MSDVYIDGQRIAIDPATSIGKGGEADIYRIGPKVALKIYKTPDHPDISGIPDPEERKREKEAATRRIAEHQKKLMAVPRNLPPHIVAPAKLARADKSGTGAIVGYTMPLVDNATSLLSFSAWSYREGGGATDETTALMMRDLYNTVDLAHQAGLIIGDFNDMNVLVRGTEAYLLDIDSASFGGFLCRVFTSKFVDPTLCDPKEKKLLLVRPHNENSDWYAFTVMFMQSFLYVGPYGGVYKPKDKTKKIPHDARPLRRVTVFDPEVQYPQGERARPLETFPDTVLCYLKDMFEKDVRTPFPVSTLERFQFDKNGRLLSVIKPVSTPETVKEVSMATVSAQKVFSTAGRILCTAFQGGKLAWLFYRDGEYVREDGTVVGKGALDPNIRYRVHKRKTIIAKGGRAFVFSPDGPPQQLSVETFGQLPLIDANEHAVYFIENGMLKKTGPLGVQYSERIGDVLSSQTLFWAGADLGFGFYRAGSLSRYFIFDAQKGGLNDSVALPVMKGQLVDATCQFSKSNIWFFVSSRESGDTINRCFLLDSKGILIASGEAKEDDGTWLSGIRGKTAIGKFLLAPTDDGIVRVEANGSSLSVVKEFPDTARFVNSGSQLFPGTGGLSVVSSREVWNLQLK